MAITFHGLGRAAQERKDFTAAEEWYRKSIAIKQKSGNEYAKAVTYSQLGLLESDRGRFVEAGQWLISALRTFRMEDPHSEDTVTKAYLLAHHHALGHEKAQLENLWRAAELGPFPEYKIK